ncbi:MAG: hypothetical protein HETSPECPRED_000394 [Heterodermia speciosa]|uniref:DNA/RNA-binding protein Kin17 WH-like domain-containing protein n=1 Tax=Heterodermia speciosa TaxID=116794 RepID=A0A8H3IFC0_9LECA|nr:MAG: hypothetical protein HETSPECPRED_000394 [Heterodermia speciosa]
MPRAEVGSTKYLNNKLKSKGLQRLRWYCQVCEKQTRDENGFKCHTQSESHVRQMLLVGEDPRKHISSFSNDFQRDFLQLLRTAHGEKKVHINHFYQEYISNKEHVHMNATRWPSLTEFAKHLGREGICRVEDVEGKGLHVAWIDNSPEALRRQDAIRKKERMDRGDEEREQRLIREQIERAEAEKADEQEEEGDRELRRQEGEKITLSFGKAKAKGPEPDVSSTKENLNQVADEPPAGDDGKTTISTSQDITSPTDALPPSEPSEPAKSTSPPTTTIPQAPPNSITTSKLSLKATPSSKPKNVFASAPKKNALGSSSKPVSKPASTKPMSEAERIMKAEIERKRSREVGGFTGGLNAKRQRVS